MINLLCIIAAVLCVIVIYACLKVSSDNDDD